MDPAQLTLTLAWACAKAEADLMDRTGPVELARQRVVCKVIMLVLNTN